MLSKNLSNHNYPYIQNEAGLNLEIESGSVRG